MVGGDEARINAQAAVAVALREITENLIVSFVFFEDVEDVLKNGRFAHPRRHGHGQFARLRRLTGLFDLADAAVFAGLSGVLIESLQGRNGNLVSGAEKGADLPGAIGGLAVAAAEAFDV